MRQTRQRLGALPQQTGHGRNRRKSRGRSWPAVMPCRRLRGRDQGDSDDRPLVVRRDTHIPSPPATLFAFLTDPEKILSWMGAEATTEPHPGGLYLVKGIGGGNAARGSSARWRRFIGSPTAS